MRLVSRSGDPGSGHRLVKRLTDFIGDILFAMCAMCAVGFLGMTFLFLAVELSK